MEKKDVQELLRINGLKQWQLADELGISEFTMCKRLRYSLNEDSENEIRAAIQRLNERKTNG